MEISTATGVDGESAEVEWEEPEPERDFRLISFRAETDGVSSFSGVAGLESDREEEEDDDDEPFRDDKRIAG
jgi:hypothetical protein